MFSAFSRNISTAKSSHRTKRPADASAAPDFWPHHESHWPSFFTRCRVLREVPGISAPDKTDICVTAMSSMSFILRRWLPFDPQSLVIQQALHTVISTVLLFVYYEIDLFYLPQRHCRPHEHLDLLPAPFLRASQAVLRRVL